MKVISDLIITEKNTGSVFVFPSEAAAVQRRKEFLRNSGKKAVRKNRFISWDSFKEQITLHNREERPMNALLRRLFAADIIRENSNGKPIFSRLIPAEYSGQAGAFSEVIYRILPELNSLAGVLDSDGGIFAPELKTDYLQLHKRYISFMQTNRLYEPSWELPGLSRPDRIYYIICPELIEDYNEYSVLLAAAGCRTIGIQNAVGPELRLFENTVIETDIVLNEIEDLLLCGTDYSDIAVTCADPAAVDILLSAARLRGIPLRHRSGKTLAEYPAGRLPELLRACRNSNYSIESMKNLLLYRAFIWKEAETASALVRFGIENRCLKNTGPGNSDDIWASRLSAAGRTDLAGFYRKLKSRIEAVNRCRNFSRLAQEVQAFISSFLETDSDIWNVDCEQVFQRSREVLAVLRETSEQLDSLSIDDPLGLWIDILREKIYVRQQPGPGIAVYPYRVSALINPAVHFVIGLSHESSGAVSTSFSFLTDQQRRDIGTNELNMTDDFIRSYAQSGADVRFSCSSETPEGTALPPGIFIESGRINRIVFSPGGNTGQAQFNAPVPAETRWWSAVCSGVQGPLPVLSKIQLEGFSYAAATFMSGKDFDSTSEAFPESPVLNSLLTNLQDKSGLMKISASSLNRWSACRFNFLLTDLLEVYENEYVLKPEDPMTAGNVLHEILYDFFCRLKEDGRPFSSARLEEYRELIRHSAAGVFYRWENEENYFYGPAWDALKRRGLQDLSRFPSAEAEYYDGYEPAGLEMPLGYALDNEKIFVKGRVDRISAGPDGAVIVDYKKSWKKQGKSRFIQTDESGGLLPPEKGYQLPFYIILARAAGFSVAGTSYYSIEDGVHFPVSGAGGVLDEEDVENLCRLTIESIRQMASAVRHGDFTAVKRCDGCGFRAVCRKRFNVGRDS